jgi:hypothetical protein
MVYMNTNVTRGAGDFVVTATGMATEVGRISGMLADEQAVKTPLIRELDRLTGQILVIAGLALVASLNASRARLALVHLWAAIRPGRASGTRVGLDAPGGNRVSQCRVVAFGLVGIGLAEFGHGMVELV